MEHSVAADQETGEHLQTVPFSYTFAPLPPILPMTIIMVLPTTHQQERTIQQVMHGQNLTPHRLLTVYLVCGIL
jgi:hypothetical protein